MRMPLGDEVRGDTRAGVGVKIGRLGMNGYDFSAGKRMKIIHCMDDFHPLK